MEGLALEGPVLVVGAGAVAYLVLAVPVAPQPVLGVEEGRDTALLKVD